MTGLAKSLMRRMHGLMFKLPLMISCDEFEAFILAYLDGELPQRQRRVFEMHLKVCRECRDYLTAYRTAMDLAKHALKDDDALRPEEVPQDLIKAVLAARDV